MRCILCKRFSFPLICSACQEMFLTPGLYTRELQSGFVAHSFFRYSEINELVKTKYEPIGKSVFKILGKRMAMKFCETFSFENPVTLLPVDDRVDKGFSHTAMLAKQLQQTTLNVKYANLMAKNPMTYSGRNYQYRVQNPRQFVYRGGKNIDVILLDDVVTTGLTLLEARETLIRQGVNVLFAVTLTDAREEKEKA